jgi:nicotinate-nucleotide pyrophosphorylase (carboxylating)
MEYLEQEVRRSIFLTLSENRKNTPLSPGNAHGQADFILKQPSKIAGLRFLPWICEAIDPALKWQVHAFEGQDCDHGTVIASIEGKAHSILSGERTALDILQHASSIAHLTSQFVKAIDGLRCDILDTRNTLPQLRAIHKYAVTVGGGKHSRFHLEERFLIKLDHLALLKERNARPMLEAVKRAKILQPNVKVEVEVNDLSLLEQALEGKADLILLENLPVEAVAKAVEIANGKAYLEVSGGITFENVRNYAATGVNGISIGALTHSVSLVDIALRMQS